jgi:hypothetical protein
VDILFKDDVTVLLLLCISFLVIDERHGREDWRESVMGSEEGGEAGVEKAGQERDVRKGGRRQEKGSKVWRKGKKGEERLN